ncbi:MAG: hypothetical protein PVH00_03640 [Gemmatimonadota bacterium]|jgi:hypothetical protein
MAAFVLALHSGIRYLVLAAAVCTIVLGAITRIRPAGRGLRGVWKGFVGLLDLQVLVGVVVLVTRPFQARFIGHFTMMLLALAVAHAVGLAFRRRPPERQVGGALMAGALLALVLVVGGILAIGRPLI